MPADTKEKPGGVSFAAIVLTLMSAFGLLSVAFSILTLFLAHSPIPHIPLARIIFAAANLLILTLVLWCFWTVVGLFRFRTWARYSIIIIGVLDFVFFAALSGLMAYLHGNPMIAGMDAHPNRALPFSAGALIIGLSAFYGFLALIGLWWMVYFNLRHVRLAFMPNAGPV